MRFETGNRHRSNPGTQARMSKKEYPYGCIGALNPKPPCSVYRVLGIIRRNSHIPTSALSYQRCLGDVRLCNNILQAKAQAHSKRNPGAHPLLSPKLLYDPKPSMLNLTSQTRRHWWLRSSHSFAMGSASADSSLGLCSRQKQQHKEPDC